MTPAKLLKRLINRHTFFLFITVLLLASFYAAKSFGEQANTSDQSLKQRLLYYVSLLIQQGHYSPQHIDDSLSERVYINYLRTLDNSYDIFLEEDIRSLNHFKFELDQEMLNQKQISFMPIVSELFDKRIVEVDSIRKKILSQTFDYTKSESYQSPSQSEYFAQRNLVGRDYENPQTIPDILHMDFPDTQEERYEKWRKKLKQASIDIYAGLLQQAKLAATGEQSINQDSLEQESRRAISRRYDRFFNRMYRHFDDEDRFSLYLNTIMRIMDPHSTYLSPVDARSYEESTSGTFYGIGALLTEESGHVKIQNVSTGGAAWKSRQIDPDDYILKVGQGRDSSVDIVGYEVTEAVRLIRGDKGTEVHLTIKKQDGSTKDVYLIRDKIFLNQTFVRTAVIPHGDKQVGYIYLPEFYNTVEMEDNVKKSPQSSEDVKEALIRLQEYGVDGVVIDLRNNGGGFLYDAIRMAGLFIPKGPIVQVKGKQNPPVPLQDMDTSVIYSGPLVVMVNEYSASASEIFAAAMQDYQRGIVVGAHSSYGKGTVQKGAISFAALFGEKEDVGMANLTVQKFYRINGHSTQLKGVISDVLLPSPTERLRRKERDIVYSLPYDSILHTSYQAYNPGRYSYHNIIEKAKKRITNSPYYQAIDSYAKWLETSYQKPTTLNLIKYQRTLKERTSYRNRIDSIGKGVDSLQVHILEQDSLKYAKLDSAESSLFFNWYDNLKGDIALQSAVAVVKDMVDPSSYEDVYANIRQPRSQRKSSQKKQKSVK